MKYLAVKETDVSQVGAGQKTELRQGEYRTYIYDGETPTSPFSASKQSTKCSVSGIRPEDMVLKKEVGLT